MLRDWLRLLNITNTPPNNHFPIASAMLAMSYSDHYKLHDIDSFTCRNRDSKSSDYHMSPIFAADKV